MLQGALGDKLVRFLDAVDHPREKLEKLRERFEPKRTVAKGDTVQKVINMAYTGQDMACLLYTSPSPRDGLLSRMPSSA